MDNRDAIEMFQIFAKAFNKNELVGYAVRQCIQNGWNIEEFENRLHVDGEEFQLENNIQTTNKPSEKTIRTESQKTIARRVLEFNIYGLLKTLKFYPTAYEICQKLGIHRGKLSYSLDALCRSGKVEKLIIKDSDPSWMNVLARAMPCAKQYYIKNKFITLYKLK